MPDEILEEGLPADDEKGGDKGGEKGGDKGGGK